MFGTEKAKMTIGPVILEKRNGQKIAGRCSYDPELGAFYVFVPIRDGEGVLVDWVPHMFLREYVAEMIEVDDEGVDDFYKRPQPLAVVTPPARPVTQQVKQEIQASMDSLGPNYVSPEDILGHAGQIRGTSHLPHFVNQNLANESGGGFGGFSSLE